MGRWLTADPIGYQGGINLYGYVRNRSTIGIDPSGLDISIGPSGNPWLVFNESVVSNGLDTGMNALYTSFTFGAYNGGNFKNQIGYDESVLLGDFARDTLIDALGGWINRAATLGKLGKASSLIRKATYIWEGMGNDLAYLKNPFLYEVGQKTIPDFAKYECLTPIARGRALIQDKGWFKAIFVPEGNFLPGGPTFSTGPTPGFRWMLRGGARYLEASSYVERKRKKE